MASDFRHAAEHVQGIESLEVLTDGPVGVGTRFRETRVMLGKKSTEEKEVTKFDPPHSYAVECESCGSRFLAEYRFIGDIAGTHLRVDFETYPVSLLVKLMSPLSKLMLGPMKKCVAADFEDLKNVAQPREG